MQTFYFVGHNKLNKSGSSFKVWKIARKGRTVTTQWGPVEQVGRRFVPKGKLTSKSVRFRSEADAKAEVEYKIHSKRLKGYAQQVRPGVPGARVHRIQSTTRAISIRQPYAEQILRGTKTKEYRSQLTRIRERVYLYASLAPAKDASAWRTIDKEPGELPTGVIVGSVEITDCRWDGRRFDYAYVLEKPRRIRPHLEPINQPQPKFWWPQFK